MSVIGFDFYTSEGAVLADKLFADIIQGITAAQFTRSEAMDKMADAVERIGAIDPGMADPDAVKAIVRKMGRIFSKAGFSPISSEELRKHCDEYARSGPSFSHEEVPPSVKLLKEAARNVMQVAQPILQRSDVKAAIAVNDPLSPEFEEEPAAQADIALYVYRGDVSRNAMLGCVLRGPDGQAYLEDVLARPNTAELLRNIIFKRDNIEYISLGADLKRLGQTMDFINLAASMVNSPDRLDISLVHDETGLRLKTRWEGDTVDVARPQDPSTAMLMHRHPVADTFLPESLRDEQEFPAVEFESEPMRAEPEPHVPAGPTL